MRFWAILFLLISGITSFACELDIPSGYYISPVDFKIYLSGTFGEPRKTHFHTGIDIKTGGVEGKAIRAVADGFISRINISPYGYGNALYITHPNGTVSVYAHLQKFDSKIQAFVKQKQKELTQFAINLEDLPSDLFPIKQGESIALSGNSGGSGGPHLHFEIRDSLEHPLNPLLYGFDEWITDNANPNIYNLYFYNLDDNRFFTSSFKKGASNNAYGKYTINGVVKVNTDELGIGVHTVDLFTGTSNKNGVYEIELLFDNQVIYHYQMDYLSFDFSKHVYSHCDYWQKKMNNNTIHKCFVEKGNQLPTYPYLLNKGAIILADDAIHQVTIRVSDYHGNTSEISCQVQKDNTQKVFVPSTYDYVDYLIANQRNTYRSDNITIQFPKDVLFDDLYFDYSETKNNEWGPFYNIHHKKTPVGGYFDLSLRIQNIDSSFIDKYLVAYYNYKDYKKALGGSVKDSFIHVKSRDFGTYFIDIDTIAPVITPVNISAGKNMRTAKVIQVKATDNFSGIDTYDAIVNGQWSVLEYDAKRRLFTYRIDEAVVAGENEIIFVIGDERGNVSQVDYRFQY